VVEDVTDIILNLKQLAIRLHSDEEKILSLDATGPGEVTAGDLTGDPSVEICDPDVHIATLNDLEPRHEALFGKLATTATKLAAERGFDSAGFRLVVNCNSAGGQTVFHIHMHLLGGRSLTWPPG